MLYAFGSSCFELPARLLGLLGVCRIIGQNWGLQTRQM